MEEPINPEDKNLQKTEEEIDRRANEKAQKLLEDYKNKGNNNDDPLAQLQKEREEKEKIENEIKKNIEFEYFMENFGENFGKLFTQDFKKTLEDIKGLTADNNFKANKIIENFFKDEDVKGVLSIYYQNALKTFLETPMEQRKGSMLLKDLMEDYKSTVAKLEAERLKSGATASGYKPDYNPNFFKRGEKVKGLFV